jgi:protein glucosyltransferase
MGGLIADERRAANKKRILHISLGFIIGLLVGGIGVGWLAQWANGTDWRDVGGSLIRGPRCPRCPKGGEVRYVEKQCPVCPKTPQTEVRTVVEKENSDCPPVVACKCDAAATGASPKPNVDCPVCDPCPHEAGKAAPSSRDALETEPASRPGKEAKVQMEARLKAVETDATDDAPPASAVNRSNDAAKASDENDESLPEIFDWSPFVYRSLFPYNKISKADVDTAEVVAGISVNAFRAQIIKGKLYVKDIRALQFARDFAPSWKITLLETMRRHVDLPDVDAVFNEGDYPISQLPNDGAHAQRLYGREGMENGQKPPPIFSPTVNTATTRDIPFPDFSFSPPGHRGADKLTTSRWSVAHTRVMAAGVAIPFEKKLPFAAFTGNTQAEPRQRLALVAKSNPDVLFVNQVYKKSDTGGKSCVDLGLADKGGLQEDKCALSFEEMCGYRYLVNVGSNGYANKLKSLFLCGSVLINVESSAPNKEFFEHQLLPGVHYVSVRDAADVPDVVRAMELDKPRAEAIARAGTKRMAAFTDEAVYEYVASVLTEYASRMTFKPARAPGSFEVKCEDDLYRHYDHDGGMLRFLTEDNGTCIGDGVKTPVSGPGWGGAYDPAEGSIPCEAANDIKEVPDACPDVKWGGWGKRCARVECAEWMPEDDAKSSRR